MLRILIRLAVNFVAALARGWDRVQLLFLSKGGADKRNSERFATFEQRQKEAERLDRLRNPRDYQGR